MADVPSPLPPLTPAVALAPMPMNVHPPGPHVHDHGSHRHGHDTRADAIMFYTMVIGAVVMQFVLQYWRQTHPRSFNLASLGGLWLLPAATSVVSGYWRFVAVWLLYSCAAAVFLRLARERPLRTSTPRLVYRFFEVAYATSTGLAAAGYSTLLIAVMLPGAAVLLPRALVDILLTAVMFGVYFGVLTRDLAELAGETIASSLGYSKRRGDDDSRPVPRGLCALCGEDLLPPGQEEEGGESLRQQLNALQEPARAPSAAAGPAGTAAAVAAAAAAAPRTVRLAAGGGRVIYKLECGHVFHGSCILGWCVVGKKGTCPCCLERVDLRAVVGDTVWAQSSLLWTRIMDAVRYMVVWMPILALAVRFVMYQAGVKPATTVDVVAPGAAPPGGADAPA